jgi:hypothetical protein
MQRPRFGVWEFLAGQSLEGEKGRLPVINGFSHPMQNPPIGRCSPEAMSGQDGATLGRG